MPIFRKIILIYLFLSLGNIAFASASSNIAVFFPDAKEPYRSIYQEIISGIKSDVPENRIKQYVLTKEFDTNLIIDRLKKNNINKVIVLGRLGLKLAKQLPDDIHVISGALPISPNGLSGISLISDPAYLFGYLVDVAPTIKTIHVAYSHKSQWMIELAMTAAKKQGLKLNARQVANTAEAIEFYNYLFSSSINKTDAIWLPLDRVSSHDKVILPIILEKAWSKEIVVFSSKPSHAKRGALFSTYPDNYKLGNQLYKMIMDIAEAPDKTKFAVLKSLQLAVNLRTAAHLGLKYSSEQKKQFKLTFPE
ncbi:ABC transporter substrate binding protein [Aliikangiella sp. IMCC44359]|uniref:ABC transporter substrate binding protein n=1 Tax=Aliikangiella sp. IMCC44359 TaxID=3459125 RepID=UPI00403AA3AB